MVMFDNSRAGLYITWSCI